jgi:5-oxoprolinase (ATP-hydrolysing)
MIRYDGTDTALPVNFDTGARSSMRATEFEKAHKAQFGFIYDDKPAVVESVDLQGMDGRVAGRDETARRDDRRRPAKPSDTRKVFSRANGTKRPSTAARACKPGNRVPAGAGDREPPDHRGRVRLAGGDHRQATTCCCAVIERKRRMAALGTEPPIR